MRITTLSTVLFLFLSTSLSLLQSGNVYAGETYHHDRKAPKLVVQITVDQLRGDLPMRF